MMLNDKEAWVPESAIKALQTVCHPVHGKRDLPVWIDALCINQVDDAEKSHQFAMMGDIYANAKEVLVYLGDEDETTERGVNAMNEVIQALSNHVMLNEQFFPDWITWIHVFQLFKVPYVRRLRPIQETTRAASVTCWRGRFSIACEHLLSIIEIWDEFTDGNQEFSELN